MKKLSVKKEMLIALAIIVLTIALSGSVFATSNPPISSPVNVTGIGQSNIVDNTNTLPANNAVITPTATPTATPTVNTISNYENTLPQTGDASDYAVFALIGVSAVVAIFAFKKARDYNI